MQCTGAKRPWSTEGSEEPAEQLGKRPMSALEGQAKAAQRFSTFLQDVLTSGTSSQTEAVIKALQLAKEVDSSAPQPKYFQGAFRADELSHRLRSIDAIANRSEPPGGAPSSAEATAKELYGNLFFLCNALKLRQGQPATAEDPNFDAAGVDRFFGGFPTEAQEAASNSSFSALGGLADAVVQEGSGDLGESPAKLRAVLLMMAHPGLMDPSDFEVFRKVNRLVAQLHLQTAARETLVRWYATVPLPVLERLVGQVQQFITLSLLEALSAETASSLEVVMRIAAGGELARHTRSALRVLDILWQANEQRRKLKEDWRTFRKAQQMRQRGEPFEDEASRFLPRTHFHNDAINESEGILKHDLKEALEIQGRGSSQEGVEEGKRCDFGIIEFSFVLTPVAKVRMLNIESLLLQREELRSELARQLLHHGRLPMSPFLVLKVRRAAVVEDALQQLAAAGSESFKRPLKIVFVGEEGVDEGGVQKEFFQLLIEELYNEDFGMFERVEESRNFWFNKKSFETSVQFQLFGIVLGLAIYNQVILDVKFPRAIYKKLISGGNISLGLSDLLDFDPSLAQGLIALMEHGDSSNFQDVFGPLHFVVEYECFGSTVQAELKEGGKDIDVTFENREEYVQRYCEWIFNEAVEKQYGAFRKGFDQCIGNTLFRRLFRDDELETVICGSVELDFHALEKVTKYRDGFNASSDAIKWFWEVAHSLSEQEKRSFLAFSTGCDRAPVGGLGQLKLIISRAGPDSEMLPSAHTCFNQLLLNAYATKERLESRLRLAIQHCTGFGLR